MKFTFLLLYIFTTSRFSLGLLSPCNENKPCKNNGHCVLNERVGAPNYCECPSNFVGPRCEYQNPCYVANTIRGGATTQRPVCANGARCNLALSVDKGASFTCECPIGFTGFLCDKPTDDNACYSTQNPTGPCLNGATCKIVGPTPSHFACRCPDGFKGDKCEVVDHCQGRPCQNGALCVVTNDTYVCRCTPGFTGKTCTEDIDECSVMHGSGPPCLNQGTCLNIIGSFKCICPVDFTGDRCESRFYPCNPSPCLNKGICVITGEHSHKCQCQAGFTGINCEINIDECTLGHKCSNGSTCLDRVNSYTCQCPPQLKGTYCEEDVDECTLMGSQLCRNGATCLNHHGGHSCVCVNGWTGPDCSENIDDCYITSSGQASPVCMNGATCHDRVGSYYCQCPPGKTGLICHLDDACSTNPCSGGSVCTTNFINGDYVCSCPPGFTGNDCTQDVDECLLGSPCEHGGSCVNVPGTFECACLPGFSGPRCETNVNECATEPCLNDGTCLDETGKYTCVCMPGYTGERCEVEIDECASHPCHNGATCTDLIDGFTCTCPMGFTGPRCDFNIDDCAYDSDPAGPKCLNGGTCLDRIGHYVCACAPGYDGLTCESNVNQCLQNSRLCGPRGSCLNEPDPTTGKRYSCKCEPGWGGPRCNTKLDPCNIGNSASTIAYYDKLYGPPSPNAMVASGNVRTKSPCQNGGICHVVYNNEFKFRQGRSYNNYESQQVPVNRLERSFETANATGINASSSGEGLRGKRSPLFSRQSSSSSLSIDYECECLPGTYGDRCEYNYDDCLTNPCRNGATCRDMINGYECTCALGFEGRNCEVDVNECSPNPCLNDGKCSDRVNGYTCKCKRGFYGTNCNSDYDECRTNPCLNGGVCVKSDSGYRCECGNGYTGVRCQSKVDPCHHNPCQHGGYCVKRYPQNMQHTNRGMASYSNSYPNYVCRCLPGYRGRDCEQNVNECLATSSNPCANGGTCIDLTDAYKCVCRDGWTGTDCTLPQDPCRLQHGNSPCLNGGVCYPNNNNLPNDGASFSYICKCPTGFTGQLCAEDVDECYESDRSNQEGGSQKGPCRNGASCVNTFGSYECKCEPGFGGSNCEHEIDECLLAALTESGYNPSVYYDRVASTKRALTTAPGWATTSDNPCHNGATCVDGLNSFTCLCPPGFTGDRCRTEINECAPPTSDNAFNNTVASPCLNGGTCRDYVDSFVCTCPLGFSGSRCEINDPDCTPSSCLNGATCVDGVHGYTCQCRPGFKGKHCQSREDPCTTGSPESESALGRTGPCLNGGTCVSLAFASAFSTSAVAPSSPKFACHCPRGFMGMLCEKRVDPCATHPPVCQNGATCYNGPSPLDFNEEEGEAGLLQLQTSDSFHCQCTPGWTGHLCDVRMTSCRAMHDTAPESVCENGGTCVDVHYPGPPPLLFHKCRCPEGFEGSRCQNTVDQCQILNPCANGATCSNVKGDTKPYACDCLPGFEGLNCEINKDDCRGNPCKHGGICHDLVNNFSCSCPAGTMGFMCEINVNECLDVVCHHGGTCVDKIGAAECICPPGFVGQRCEGDVNECLSNPCHSMGSKDCIQLNNDYKCVCRPGYRGRHCEQKYDQCALQNPCQHSGFCRNSVNGGFECMCKPGFWGSTCQHELTTCRTNPCQVEEWCLDGDKGRRCYCDPERTYEIRESPSSHKMYSRDTKSDANSHRCLAYRATMMVKAKPRQNLEVKEKSIVSNAPELNENAVTKHNTETSARELQECMASGCPNPGSELGNGVCDRNCNTKACDWDGRDCSLGLNPWAKCQAPNGTRCWDRYGDGFCDPECDSLACLFDGFDCRRRPEQPEIDDNYPNPCPSYCSSAFATDLCDPSCTPASTKNSLPTPSLAEGSLILVLNVPPEKIIPSNNSTSGPQNGDGPSVLQALSLFLGTPLRFKKDRWGNPMVFPTPSGQELNGQYPNSGMGSSKIYLELDRSQCVGERDGLESGECFSQVGDAARFIAAAAVQGKLPPQLLRLESVQGLGENGEDDGDPLGGGSGDSDKGGNTFRGTANQLTHIFAGGTAFLIISLLVGVLYSTQKRKRISRGITWFPEGFSLTTPPLAKKAKRSSKPGGGPKSSCKRGKMCAYEDEGGLHGDSSSYFNDDNTDMNSGQWVLKPKAGTGTGGPCSEYSDNNSDNGTTGPVHYSPPPEEIMMRRREMARINANDGRNRPDGQEMRYADGNPRAGYDYGQQQPRYTNNTTNTNNDYPIFLTVDRARNQGTTAPYYPDPRQHQGSYYLTTAGETDPLYPQPGTETLKRQGPDHYNTLNPNFGPQNEYHPCLWPGPQMVARVRQDARQWTAQHYAASQGCRVVGKPGESRIRNKNGEEASDPLATSILTPPFTTQDEECMQQLKRSEPSAPGLTSTGEMGTYQAKEDVNAEGPAGITPIMISTTIDQCMTSSEGNGAKDQQGLNTTQYLILKGAKIDARTDDTHENPLHLAARFSRADSARFLLEAGADVNAQDYTGRTPLHTAIASDARGVFHLLLRSKFVRIDAPSQDGTTPLILSARLCSDVEMAKLLVEAGADINAADDNGRTALHWASAVNNYKIVRMLLEKGANPDAQDSKDETSIFLAAREGSYESAKILLIDFKANPDIANNVDILPIDIARDRLHSDIFELIAHKRERKLLYATSAHAPINKKALNTNSPSKHSKPSVPTIKTDSRSTEVDNNTKVGGAYRQPPLGYGQQVSVEPKLYPIVEIEDASSRQMIPHSHSDQMTPPRQQEIATTHGGVINATVTTKDNNNLSLAKIDVTNHHERCSSLLTPEKSPHYQHPHYQQLHQAHQYQAQFSANKQFEAVPAQFYQSTPYNRQQCMMPLPPQPSQAQYYDGRYQGPNGAGLLPFVSCYNYSNSSSSVTSSNNTNNQHSSASSEQQRSVPFLPPAFRNKVMGGPSLNSLNPFDNLSTLTLTPPSVQSQDVPDELTTVQSLQSNVGDPKGQDHYGVGDYYGHDKLHMVSYPTPSPESSLDKWSYYSDSPPSHLEDGGNQQAPLPTTTLVGYQGAPAHGSDLGSQQTYRTPTNTLQYEDILKQGNGNVHDYAPSTGYNNDLSSLNDLLLNVQPEQNYGSLSFNESMNPNRQGSQNASLPHRNPDSNNHKTAIII